MSNESTGDDNKNRKIGRVIAVIVAVIVIAALIIGGGRTSETVSTADGLPEGCKPGFLFSETTGKPCPQEESVVANDTVLATTTGSSAYEDAIRTYAGKVVVFDAACKPVATPSSVTAGTRVLIANNSDKELTLAVGQKSEVLDGYHYFTTTLTTKGDAKVMCNGKEAATISVK